MKADDTTICWGSNGAGQAPSVQLTPSTLPDAVAGGAYSAQLSLESASYTVVSPVFTATATLPAGLALSSDGTLSGTPTASGAFSVTVSARDANGFRATAAVSLVVERGVSIADAVVVEGAAGTTPLTFTVTLSDASTDPITVTYSVDQFEATATLGSDYDLADGTLVFAPGTLTQTITAQVYGDATVEGNERFGITLSDPINVVLGDGDAVGRITNDDPADATVDVLDNFFDPAVLTVTLGAASGQAIVLWDNLGSNDHNVVSVDGVFDSDNVAPGAAFTFAFTTTGTYSYTCTYHTGMNGQVTVLAAPPAPTPTITPTPLPADATVDMLDNFFDPAAIMVTLGATSGTAVVRWQNLGQDDHNVLSDDNVFDSDNVAPGEQFTFAFTTTGTYSYTCTYHTGMNGRVTVLDPPPAPTPTITPTPLPADATVDVLDNFFDPAAITVTLGAASGTAVVRWQNLGQDDHNVVSDDGVFDSDNVAPGEQFTFAFTTTGTYSYTCTYHAGMNGRVTVLDPPPAPTPTVTSQPPTMTPVPSATATATSTATGAPSPTPTTTRTATGAPSVTATTQPATATRTATTGAPSPTVTRTVTTGAPSATATAQPATATSTATTNAPSATATTQPATVTTQPATVTPTAQPATATRTAQPATATPTATTVLPSATATRTATAQPSGVRIYLPLMLR